MILINRFLFDTVIFLYRANIIQKSILDCVERTDDPAEKYKMFLCTQCHTHVKGRHVYLNHQLSCSIYFCVVCKKRFHSSATFKKHLKTNCPPKRHMCHKCQKTFSRKGDRDIHAKSCIVHQTYTCTKCLKTFLTKVWLMQHGSVCDSHKLSSSDTSTNAASKKMYEPYYSLLCENLIFITIYKNNTHQKMIFCSKTDECPQEEAIKE